MGLETQWQRHFLYKRFVGHVTAQELIRSVELTHNDPRYDDLSYSVNDFSDAELGQLSDEQLMLVAAATIGAGYSNRKLRIVLILSDPRALRLAGQFAALSPFETHVFPDRAQANAWLPQAHQIRPDAPGSAPQKSPSPPAPPTSPA
ncbi:MAG TPA: hypothetical protein VFY35_09525 [Burkholderiaceae bacterium]|nr:hypothetical protein [Burkholderiaceae bacterium]